MASIPTSKIPTISDFLDIARPPYLDRKLDDLTGEVEEERPSSFQGNCGAKSGSTTL
jgi:hypothetical protein